MRKLIITCDCCGKNIEETELYSVDHYVHVSPTYNRLLGHSKVIDGKDHATSGRKETKEFCLPCYNMLFGAFFTALESYKSLRSTDLPY